MNIKAAITARAMLIIAIIFILNGCISRRVVKYEVSGNVAVEPSIVGVAYEDGSFYYDEFENKTQTYYVNNPKITQDYNSIIKKNKISIEDSANYYMLISYVKQKDLTICTTTTVSTGNYGSGHIAYYNTNNQQCFKDTSFLKIGLYDKKNDKLIKEIKTEYRYNNYVFFGPKTSCLWQDNFIKRLFVVFTLGTGLITCIPGMEMGNGNIPYHVGNMVKELFKTPNKYK
jgi:hypothetical protein